MKSKFNMSVSNEAKLALYERKKGKNIIIGDNPIDRPGCICHQLVALNINSGVKKLVTCPKGEGLKKWKVNCSKCGEQLAYFKSKEGSLDGEYYDLHYICWHDKTSWHGCITVNVNPYNSKINFECACGNREIEEPSLDNRSLKMAGLKNKKRYTRFKITNG